MHAGARERQWAPLVVPRREELSHECPTEGVIGPNLDQLRGTGPKSADTVKANRCRVLIAVENGIGGRMPKGIPPGEQAKAVAQFVADNVQYIGP